MGSQNYIRGPALTGRPLAHAILHYAAEFHPNRTTCCRNMTSYPFFQDGGSDRLIVLPVSYLLMSLPSEGGQNLSANQISSTYLN